MATGWTSRYRVSRAGLPTGCSSDLPGIPRAPRAASRRRRRARSTCRGACLSMTSRTHSPISSALLASRPNTEATRLRPPAREQSLRASSSDQPSERVCDSRFEGQAYAAHTGCGSCSCTLTRGLRPCKRATLLQCRFLRSGWDQWPEGVAGSGGALSASSLLPSRYRRPPTPGRAGERTVVSSRFASGASRARTDDLLHAMSEQALSVCFREQRFQPFAGQSSRCGRPSGAVSCILSLPDRFQERCWMCRCLRCIRPSRVRTAQPPRGRRVHRFESRARNGLRNRECHAEVPNLRASVNGALRPHRSHR